MTHKEVVLDAIMLVLGHDHEVHPGAECPVLKTAREIIDAIEVSKIVTV